MSSSRRRPSFVQRQQRLCSIILDSATAVSVIYSLYHNPSYLDPWNIPDTKLWLLGFICIRLGVIFYDHLVVFVIENLPAVSGKLLPTREAGAPPVRYVTLDAKSIVYLSLNSLNEYTFVMRLTHYLWQGGYMGMLCWKVTDLTIGNTIVALGIMFISMDLLYAPLHHWLHLPSVYPLIHKHHHRQHYPTRGYLDAGNEHPIEHMIGVVCTWFAVCTSEVFLPTIGLLIDSMCGRRNDSIVMGGGVHALTVMIFFQFHAALACMNHSPYDVKFSLPFLGSASLLGSTESKLLQLAGGYDFSGGKWLRQLLTGQWFQYSVGHHEMHHRKFNYNYGQYCMFYDWCMGTFLEYEGPMSAAQLEKRRSSLKVE